MKTTYGRWLGLISIAAVLLLVMAGGCAPQEAPAPTVSAAGPLVISALWPAGVRAVVIQTATAFQVVDREEVLFSFETGGVSGAEGDSARTAPVSFAISAGREYLACRLGSGDVTVWHIGRDQETRRFPASRGSIDGISADGAYVSLVDGRVSASVSPPAPPTLHLRILNTISGKEIEPASITSYLQAPSPYALVSSVWLSNTYLVSLSSAGTRTHVYDPVLDALSDFPSLDEVWQASPSGAVIGGLYETSHIRSAVVVNDGLQTFLVPAPGWTPMHGSLSQDGQSAVLLLAKGSSCAWQSFRLSAQADSEVSPVPSGSYTYGEASIGSGEFAWSLREAGSERYAVSFDLKSGAWQEWLRADELRNRDVELLAVIPE